MPITAPLAVSSATLNIYAVRVTYEGGLPVIDDVELGTIGVACVGDCVSAQAATGLLPAYLVQAAVTSDVQLLAALTTPLDERTSGVPMPIIASLTDSKPILGAHLEVTISAPYGRIYQLILHDDGKHSDGAPDDDVYGNVFYQTGAAGTSSYNITLDAEGTSSLGELFTRQQILGFFILGSGDDDDDRLPNEYEERYAGKDNVTGLDPKKDPDNDGRTTGEEFEDGTDPTNPDSDNGGESDGSEKEQGSDPFDPDDDGVPSTWAVAYPGVGKTFIRYAPNSGYALVQIFKGESPDGPYSLAGEDDGTSGMIVDSNVENGKEYCYYAVGISAGGNRSAQRLPSCTMPKADPWAPDGAVLINDGAATTTSRDVILHLYASDEVSPHVDTPDELDNLMTPPASSATGVSEMRIGNEADLSDGSWQAFAATRSWTLAQSEGLAMVYVQFKDRAGNESRIIPAGILFDEGSAHKYQIMLPMIMR